MAQWNGSGINVIGKMTVSVGGPDAQGGPVDVYVAVVQVPLMGRDLQPGAAERGEQGEQLLTLKIRRVSKIPILLTLIHFAHHRGAVAPRPWPHQN